MAVAVAGGGERVDREDLPFAGSQDGDEQTAGGLDGDRYRIVLGVPVLGEQIQQFPIAGRVTCDAGLGEQLPDLVNQGDVMMFFRPVDPAEPDKLKTPMT